MKQSHNYNKKPSRSEEAFKDSCELIPGGVNSPVRSFKAVGGTPFIAEKGEGPLIYDIDGNRYVDYVMSWGPLILGHAWRSVVDAINSTAASGVSFGTPTRNELNLASIVRERMPWIEKLRLVNSGTEACMTAARIARAATGRDIIVKFDGGYHGHSDHFLVRAGSGLATHGLPASEGVPTDSIGTTVSIPYNDVNAFHECFSRYANSIACVIVEPVAANMGVIVPESIFLETLREKTHQDNSILIFDEVITGFRVAPGGAAELYNIKPDLACLGKILGGGLPIGAVGGKRELMDTLAPLGPVYQAGTLSGNPLSTSAGIATLRELENTTIYDHLKQYADDLTGEILDLCDKYGRALQVNKVESLFTLFFANNKIVDFESAQLADMEMYARFFHELLKQGVFVPPSGFEAWFVSFSHRQDHMKITTKAIEKSLSAMS